MSGHSRWANIKHKKAKEDATRGKVFTKLVKEITVAAREGGGDPAGNPRLRTIIDKARAVNMPQDNIMRAIKKGTGELDGVRYEEGVYEGYGPFGTAVIVEILTDNKQRTVADLRHAFTRNNGNMAEGGAVSWMFDHKGVIRATGTLSEDELLEKLIDQDIDDLSYQNGIFTVTCKKQDLEFVRAAVQTAGMHIEDAKLEWVAKDPLELSDKDQEEKVFKFLETLQELDDVRDVYTNLA
ncbi:MAG: YebC/PmpR family DNA-binding transcriptional regulator [bacterium]